MHRPCAALAAAALVVAAACGGDDGGANQAFCDNLASVQRQFTRLAGTTPEDLEPIIDDLADVDPPKDIADAYQDVVDLYRTVAETGSLTDPALATRLADAQAAITEIDDYVAQKCHPSKKS